MNTQITIFETGATSHAVNDLVLFTDTSRESAELRDRIYNEFMADSLVKQDRYRLPERMTSLFVAAAKQYCREIPDECQHIKILGDRALIEYCDIYANRFESWKNDRNTL